MRSFLATMAPRAAKLAPALFALSIVPLSPQVALSRLGWVGPFGADGALRVATSRRMKRNARSATVGQPAKSVRHAKARAHAGARKKPLITVEEGRRKSRPGRA